MYYYFNINSLIEDGKDVAVDANSPQCVLVDNDLRVIGNKEVYCNAIKEGQGYVKGKRLNLCQEYPPFPEMIGIEISSMCNYGCKMCPRRRIERESMHMATEIFYKIIDEIKDYDIKMLGLYRLGESLGHPEFFNFLNHVEKFGTLKNTFMSTNGSTLTDEVIERLLASNLKFLKISVNAMDRDAYKRITGQDNFKRLSTIIKSIKSRKTKRTPFISFEFLEQDVTYGQVPQFVKEYIGYADYIENSVLEDFGGQLLDNVKFLKSNVYTNPKAELFPCKRSKLGYALIYSNGNIVPCIGDINAKYLKVGNVLEQSLKDAYEGDAWAYFRHMHQQGRYGDHPLCGKCLDRMIFDLGDS